MTIFRVVQEACANAIEHSGGNRISVEIEQKANDCHIIIKDNGKGFSLQEAAREDEKHFGILIMNERVHLLGGRIDFQSDPGEGTKVEIDIPLD